MKRLQTCHHALLLSCVVLSGTVWAQDRAATATPTTDEIVQRMVEGNAERATHCGHYSGLRNYHVIYHGFPGSREAEMQVEMTYDAPNQKQFRVLSTSGSKLLIDRVLKRLTESEQEATLERDRIALTPANYKFEFENVDNTERGKSFVLKVTPKTESKFLYRGEIWVDATDYAVAKIEAMPAKNPSFWIKNSSIHQTYKKVGACWLPAENQSESKVRFGGQSKLTITYSTYKIGAGS